MQPSIQTIKYAAAAMCVRGAGVVGEQMRRSCDIDGRAGGDKVISDVEAIKLQGWDTIGLLRVCMKVCLSVFTVAVEKNR